LALSGFSFFVNSWIYFFGRPLKYFERSDRDADPNFGREGKILIGNILKVFFHPAPLWKEKVYLGLLDH
jgi:hypothetical protein